LALLASGTSEAERTQPYDNSTKLDVARRGREVWGHAYDGTFAIN